MYGPKLNSSPTFSLAWLYRPPSCIEIPYSDFTAYYKLFTGCIKSCTNPRELTLFLGWRMYSFF